MGCFDQLDIPWRQASDLTDEEHLAENFRMIDRWANPLVDTCGGCPDNARGTGGFFAGTVPIGSTADTFKGTPGGGGGIDVAGDLTYDPVTGLWTVPRDGFYISMIHLGISGAGLANPYWVQIVSGGGGHAQLIPPYAGDADFTITEQTYHRVGEQLIFGIYNNLTASHVITYDVGVVTITESPCSSIEGL